MTHKLLVVDDEDTIRNFLVRVLQREGYDVHAAKDGMEALNVLDSQPDFDLLLTDIKMDALDGVALLKRARREHPDISVVLFTGYATVPSAVEALRHGAYDYLIKPVKNEDIVRVVAAALDDRKRERRRDRLETIASQMASLLEDSEGTESPFVSPQRSGLITVAGLELNLDAYTVTLNGEKVELTPTEFRLLKALSQRPGTASDYVELVQSACGYTCTRQEAREIIGTHVLNLRQKLGIERDHPLYVESVRGVGYRLIAPEEAL